MTVSSSVPTPVTEGDRVVGERIASLRKAKPLSQTALGSAVGVTYQQVQKYETGRNRIGASRLRQIADVLGVPVSTFFDGDDSDAGQEQTEVFDLLSIHGSVDLLRAFNALEDDQTRREVLAIVRGVVRLGQEQDT